MRHSYEIVKDNLLFHPLTQETSELYRQLRNRKDVDRWFLHSDEISQKQQVKWFECYLENDNDIMFSVHMNIENARFIGAVAIYNIDWEKRVAEFGRIAILPEIQGRGLGKIIVNNICEFAQNELKLKKLYLEVFANNIAAIKTYLSVGFGLLDGHISKVGGDIICMCKVMHL